MEGNRRKPRRDTVHGEVCGYKTEVKEKIETRTRIALRNKVKEEAARPNGLPENAETAISCGGPGPARKKSNTSSREEDEDAQMCPCGKAVE